jgi:hypothetical protein
MDERSQSATAILRSFAAARAAARVLLRPVGLAVQDWQADLARRHGIHGFCYYHYWFNDKQLLEKPVELLLRRGEPDLPFCLVWANEPWTRAWDGGEHQVLMPQSYGGEADWKRHFDYLLSVFRDRRYISVDGKPMFLIYRSANIRDCEPMLRPWRGWAADAGLPGLHVVSMMTGFPVDRRRESFDAFAEFEPMYTIAHRLPYWLRKRERWIARFTCAGQRVFRTRGSAAEKSPPSAPPPPPGFNPLSPQKEGAGTLSEFRPGSPLS